MLRSCTEQSGRVREISGIGYRRSDYTSLALSRFFLTKEDIGFLSTSHSFLLANPTRYYFIIYLPIHIRPRVRLLETLGGEDSQLLGREKRVKHA